MPIVELRGVSKRYRDLHALTNVSFDLHEGEVFGYLGPNGAGKTTTLKILAGLIHKFEGSVKVAGHPLPGCRDEVHELIGFLPQSAGFQDWRTADSALRSLGILSGVPAREAGGRIGEWLDRFDLTAVRHKRINKLSGGMIQKLGLIQALLHRPKLLILDEPLSGLDPASRQLVKDVVRECKAAGTTVIFSSHILSDVQDVADRIGILHAGKLLTSGAVEDMKTEMPVRVELQFSAVPRDLAFLLEHPSVLSTVEHDSNRWVVEMRDGVDADGFLHEIVEGALRHGGRWRGLGILEPNLDDLYAQYIARASGS